MPSRLRSLVLATYCTVLALRLNRRHNAAGALHPSSWLSPSATSTNAVVSSVLSSVANGGAPRYSFSGIFATSSDKAAYAASWLVHQTKFLNTVRFGPPWTVPFDAASDMVRPGWTVDRNVTFAKGLNMEGASDIILRSSRPLKTRDMLDFAVEHLSGYEHVVNLKGLLRKPVGWWVLQVWTEAVRARVDALERGWALGIDADGGGGSGLKNHWSGGGDDDGNSTAFRIGERVLVGIPFYLNTDGGGGYQRGSIADTRTLYLRATFLSVSRIFPNVVAFVANEPDLTYVRNQSRLPFWDVVLIPNLSKGQELPMATLLEMQRRLRVNHDSWSDKFDWIYYTESDQVLRYRPHQLRDLLGQVPPGRSDSVLVPHRMVTWPISLDFGNFTHRLDDSTAAKYSRLGSRNVTVLEEPAQVRCCMGSLGSPNFDDWTMPYGEDEGSGIGQHPIHLLQAGKGAYHLLNGNCNKFKEKCWTCAISTSVDASCDERHRSGKS